MNAHSDRTDGSARLGPALDLFSVAALFQRAIKHLGMGPPNRTQFLRCRQSRTPAAPTRPTLSSTRLVGSGIGVVW